MKRKLMFIATLLVGVALARFAGVLEFGSLRVPPASGVASEPSAAAPSPLPAACLPPEDTTDALRKLSSGDSSQTNQAREFFFNKSRESETCRAEAISALMRAMDKPDLDFRGSKETYYLWRDGAELLGDLKATEAIDFLVAHLGLINDASYSMSMRHRPALLGLIRMGEIAIPKLDEVLQHNPDWQLRHDAVYCIATIGGPQAVNSLSQALSSESHKCVSRFIKISLDSFDEKGKIKNRLEWSRGISCSS